MLNFRDLECFMAVVEHKTFSRAAQSLHLAQPPLSRRIAELERALGAHLFIRGARQATLTEAGVALVREARIVLEQAKLAEVIVRDTIQGRTGHVRLGYASSSAFIAVPLAINSFKRLHPRATLKFVRYPIAHQNDALRFGAIDVALLNGVVDAEDFKTEVLSTSRFLIALPQSHPLAVLKVVPVSELASEPFIEFPRYGPTGLHDLARSVCSRSGFVPKIAQVVEGHDLVMACVAADLGVALVNQGACRHPISGVALREISPPSPEIRLTALSRPDEVNPLVLSFIEQMHLACKGSAEDTKVPAPIANRRAGSNEERMGARRH